METERNAENDRPWWQVKHHPEDCDCKVCSPPQPADTVRPCQYWIDKLNAQSTRTVKVQRMADDLAEALYRLHHFGDPELVERALAAYKATLIDGDPHG